ncbi:MAG TPA: M3 family metallopeptidase [Puia sp.]
MKSFLRISILIVSAILYNQNSFAQENQSVATNPLLNPGTLPFRAAPFDKIKDADFRPAFQEGFRLQNAEIKKIAENPTAATFKNTLVALEESGQVLKRVNGIFNLLTGANTNPELQKIEREEAPRLTAQEDNIYLNTKLFARIESIYKDRNTLPLDAESKRLVEFLFQKFVMAGARLSEENKMKLKKLNEEEASLMVRFTNQLLAATKKAALVLNASDELAGSTEGNLNALAQNAEANNMTGKWMISLQNTTQQPISQSLSDRNTREALFGASWNRAEKDDSNDTRQTIARLAQVRAEKAGLLGFPDYASWKLQNQMAKTPATVETFFGKLIPSAVIKTKEDAAFLQAQMNKKNPGMPLEAWDWDYFAEQVRKEKYDLDENDVKPYLEISRVLENGVFYAAGQLYGLSFKKRFDIPVYQKDVRVFEVFDADNKSLALFYCDYFKRDNKSGGAWKTNTTEQSFLLGTKPVIYNVCNFPKPADGQPALLSFENVRTMFHEFGHALHGFFASQQYPDLSGSKVARDFVEFPSQFNEHWALDPKVFKHYALHYKTGELMPEALVTKIKNASSFNQVYKLTEALEASVVDMRWHTLSPKDPLQNSDSLELDALQKAKLDLHQVPTRYRSTYFLHIWGNGYAAGYFAYQWTKMLSEDAFSWFEENGGMTRANGQRFRDMILSRGNTIELGKMYHDFRGRDPEIGPMQKAYGLPQQ